MLTALIVIASAIAQPVLRVVDDRLVGSGVAVESGKELCDDLQGHDAVVDAGVDIHEVLPLLRGCGVARIALRKGDKLVWLGVGARAGLVLFVNSSKTYIFWNGARAEFQLEQRDLLSELIATDLPVTLVASPRADANRLATFAAALLDEGWGTELFIATALDELDTNTEALARASVGKPGRSPKTIAGTLTRALGRSWTPKVYEREVPRWIRIGSVLCRDGEDVVAWGVGSISGLRNHALARTTADNRARAAIAKLFAITIQRAPGVIKTFTSMTLTGVQIHDHHFAADGTVFALAVKSGKYPEGPAAKKPCPVGKEVVKTLQWKPVSAEGTTSTEPPPPWTSGPRVRFQGEYLEFVAQLTPGHALADEEKRLKELVRIEAARRFAPAAKAKKLTELRAVDGRGCFTSVPWDEVAAAMEPELFWDGQTGALHARGRVSLSEVEGALPQGCEAGTARLFLQIATNEPVTQSPEVSTTPVIVDEPE